MAQLDAYVHRSRDKQYRGYHDSAMVLSGNKMVSMAATMIKMKGQWIETNPCSLRDVSIVQNT